jgi:hypothetical protein
MLTEFETQSNGFRALIGKVVAVPLLHAQWLNTFSFLEYIGFRKIVKSQQADAINISLMSHALEEGRHAFALKKLAAKIGGPTFEFYMPDTLLCGEEAGHYFQELDHRCEQAFTSQPDHIRTRLTYLYVTWLIERRAIEVYGLYRQVIGQSEIGDKLDALMGEEANHLTDFAGALQAQDPQFATRSRELQAIEASLYGGFVSALGEHLHAVAEAA